MSEPAGVYEAMQLAEASARGPFWKELQEARALAASNARLAQRYREALEAIVQSRQEAWSWSAARLRTIAARALLVEHDSPSETTTGAAVDASNTVALVVYKDDGRTITYEVSREWIRTEHDEEETP